MTRRIRARGPSRRRACGRSPRRENGCDGRHRWDHAPMDAAALRRHCLSHRGAVETFPFGPDHSVFKVAEKMFALTALDRTPLEVSLKCDPELAVELRA